MLFNSFDFIFIFFPLSYIFYFYLNHIRLTKIATFSLVLSSLLFYSIQNIIYLPLIISSILINYFLGQWIQTLNLTKSKYILIFGISLNLLLLGYYKYSNFFLDNVNELFGSHISLIQLSLPLAISFFTFQQIAYLVDSYKGKVNENNLLNYSLFVSFFPQLVAGPIVHHKMMMPQFSNLKKKIIQYKNIALGLFLFSIGLFKKTVLADTFSQWADIGFNNPSILNVIEAWATSLSYTLQIYFDFSGYTDMALGLALLFNIKLPFNFNSPYKATSIQEFWRRWHITLSQFLKEYIYIPLGGNRSTQWLTVRNILITFILGGLWHGPSWTFVIWGLLHALAILLFKLWSKYGFMMHKYMAWFLTFNFVNISWIFFRASDFSNAIIILEKMFSLPINNIINPIWISSLIIGLLIILSTKNSQQLIHTQKPNMLLIVFSGFIFSISLVLIEIRGSNEFIYFQF